VLKQASKYLIATTAILTLSCSVAMAGAMPGGKKHETVSTLDKALLEIHNKSTPDHTLATEAPPLNIMDNNPAPAEIMAVPAVAPEPVIKAVAKPAVIEQDTPAPVPKTRVVEVQPNSSFFGLSVGLYDPFTHGNMATSFNLEYQPAVRIAGILQPIFGAMITTDASFFGYTGFGVPFNLTDNIMMMPSIAAGIYDEGDGVDLDSNFAMRLGTEIAYQFEDKSRVGLNAHIIANGKSFGKKDRTEVISIVYTTPLSFSNK